MFIEKRVINLYWLPATSIYTGSKPIAMDLWPIIEIVTVLDDSINQAGLSPEVE